MWSNIDSVPQRRELKGVDFTEHNSFMLHKYFNGFLKTQWADLLNISELEILTTQESESKISSNRTDTLETKMFEQFILRVCSVLGFWCKNATPESQPQASDTTRLSDCPSPTSIYPIHDQTRLISVQSKACLTASLTVNNVTSCLVIISLLTS